MRPVASFAVCVALLSHPIAPRTEQYRTYVAPASTETMQGPCEYELTLRDASKPVKAVFVVVERGWQVGNVYFDPEVTAFAERHDLALVLARHCRAKTEEDMDIIPEHGIGRALLQSLNQFAGTLQIFQTTAGLMKISDGSASYEVRLDGKDYADPGDIHSTRSMRLIDEYTLEETDKTDGKVSGVSGWVISKDGKSMQVEFSSTKRGQTMRPARASSFPIKRSLT